jgi:hypothetical protein
MQPFSPSFNNHLKASLIITSLWQIVKTFIKKTLFIFQHNNDLLPSPNPKTSLHFAKKNSTSSLQ